MKQLLLILGLLAPFTIVAQTIVSPLSIERRSAELTDAPPGKQMEWQNPIFNFGTIDRGNPVSAVFAFRNSGETPILIKEAKGACGCTGVEYPKDPILPGEVAEIIATYDARVVGPFKKSVTVHTNLDSDEEGTVLYIKGEVIWRF